MSIRKRAGREATDWLILLQDAPDDAELRDRFERWLEASTVHADAWAQTAEIMDFVGQSEPIHSRHWQDLPGAQNQSRSRSRIGMMFSMPRLRLALSVMTAALVLWIAAPALLLRMEADHITGTGEVRQVSLADGSTVTLSAGSAIETYIGAGKRDVRLLRGSALFEVAHDAARPFHVDAGGIRTTVLGTRFEVALQEGGGTVGVIDGRVRVDYPDGAPPVSAQLGAGETLAVMRNAASRRDTVSPGNIAAWKDGQLVMSDRPAREVIEALRPWYSGMIVARGAALDKKRLTGVYDVRDPDQALAALSRARGVHVQHITPWVVVISVS